MRKADKIKIREEKEREKEAARLEKEINRCGGREHDSDSIWFRSNISLARSKKLEASKAEDIANVTVLRHAR